MTSGSLMRLSPALPAPRGQAGTGRHCPRRSHRHRGGPAGAGGARGWLLPRARAGALWVSPAVPLAPSSGQPGPDGALRPLPGASKGTGGDRRVVAGGERSPPPAPAAPGRTGPGGEGARGQPAPRQTRAGPYGAEPGRAVPGRPSPGVRGALCPPSGPRPCPAAGLAAQRSGSCCPSRSPRRFTPAQNAAQRPARGCRGAGCLCIFKYTALLGLRNNGDQ